MQVFPPSDVVQEAGLCKHHSLTIHIFAKNIVAPGLSPINNASANACISENFNHNVNCERTASTPRHGKAAWHMLAQSSFSARFIPLKT